MGVLAHHSLWIDPSAQLCVNVAMAEISPWPSRQPGTCRVAPPAVQAALWLLCFLLLPLIPLLR